jgi:hypothetical protein
MLFSNLTEETGGMFSGGGFFGGSGDNEGYSENYYGGGEFDGQYSGTETQTGYSGGGPRLGSPRRTRGRLFGNNGYGNGYYGSGTYDYGYGYDGGASITDTLISALTVAVGLFALLMVMNTVSLYLQKKGLEGLVGYPGKSLLMDSKRLGYKEQESSYLNSLYEV